MNGGNLQDWSGNGHEQRTQAAMADIAVGLKTLVDQLELNCDQRIPISTDAARELHRLRQRSELLFGDWGTPATDSTATARPGSD